MASYFQALDSIICCAILLKYSIDTDEKKSKTLNQINFNSIDIKRKIKQLVL